MSRWKSLSAFWAQLMRQPEFSHWTRAKGGYWACRDAFGPFDPEEERGNQVFLVQVACIWMVHMAERERAHVLDSSDPLNHGDWMRWKNGFQDAREMDKETRELADRALANMERAERLMPSPE